MPLPIFLEYLKKGLEQTLYVDGVYTVKMVKVKHISWILPSISFSKNDGIKNFKNGSILVCGISSTKGY